jgi:DNA (cytosine-5)-methyltransferase 1
VVNPDDASPIVSKTAAYNGSPLLYAPGGRRGLSVGEAARLCSFPDEFRFPESGKPRRDWELAWARLGNSVPPMLMRAVAAHVRREVLRK